MALLVPRIPRTAPPGVRIAAYSTTPRLYQDGFYTQRESVGAAAPFLSSPNAAVENPQTLTEKIVQRYSVGLPSGKKVKAGDYVTLQPHHVMTHDNSWPVAMKFMSIGGTKIHDNRQVVMTLDHDVQNKSESNLKKYRQIEEFARKHGVDFYPAGRGIGHQIMVEEGYAWPGTVTVASDSHSNIYGAVGAIGTPIVRTDAAAVWVCVKAPSLAFTGTTLEWARLTRRTEHWEDMVANSPDCQGDLHRYPPTRSYW